MNLDNNKYQTPEQEKVKETISSNTTAESIQERGADIYEHAEQAVCDAYKKSAHTVSDTYGHVKNYSSENPGKTIIVALGIGFGLGILLGASSRRSRGGRFVQPVLNAFSDIALGFFR